MRKPFLAANWKMNKSISEMESFFTSFNKELLNQSFNKESVDLLFAVPYLQLQAAKKYEAELFSVASQNIHQENSGAYTGEVSADMLKEIDINFSLVGHSERRQYFNETSEIVASKTKQCLERGMHPIVCVGETLDEREAQKTFEVVESQLKAVFAHINNSSIITIAYEPVWAIGTGKTASTEQAQEVHAFIRKLLEKTFDHSFAERTRILYGGSVKPANFVELLSQPDIDGGLVGGASLKVESFVELALQASKVTS
jgi:triosephosphate isomerase